MCVRTPFELYTQGCSQWRYENSSGELQIDIGSENFVRVHREPRTVVASRDFNDDRCIDSKSSK